MQGFRGQVVVVTGAAKGMGAACARRLLRPDRALVLTDIDQDGLEAVRDELLCDAAEEETVRTRRLDVTDAEGVGALAQEVSGMGTFGVLCHAAGVSPTMADWQTVVRVDLVGTALMIDAFRPLAVPGSVAVCWASMAAHMGDVAVGDPAVDAAIDDPLAPELLSRFEQALRARTGVPVTPGEAYGWAKRAVIRLVGREAAGWGSQGARICSISPGIINTPMGRQEFVNQPMMQVMLDMTPARRLGAPGEVAELAAFLASPAAGFLTGCDVLIDGGVTPTLTQQLAGGLGAPPAPHTTEAPGPA